MSNDQQYDPYGNGAGNGYGGDAGGGYDDGYGHPDPAEVAQTWQGQTWDTQYQPVVQPRPHPGTPAAYDAVPPSPQAAYGQQPYEAYAPPRAEPYPRAHAEPYPYADPYRPEPQPVPVTAPVAAPAPVAQAAYSAPTTSGNTRITDAQRARAEGRSPVIEPGMRPAVLTAVLGLLLAGGAALGSYGLLVPLVLLQGLTAAGWFRLNGMWPARQGIALAFLGGLVADAVLLVTGREHAAPAILGTLGVWVLLSLVLQLRSHADPDERVYGLMATVASAALTVVATGHLGAEPDAVVIGGIAVAATVLARALPLPGPVSAAVALLAGAGGGIAAGELTGLGAPGALLGLAAGVCALVGLRVASYDYPSRFVHMTAGIALPLTAAAPAVYLLGRALV